MFFKRSHLFVLFAFLVGSWLVAGCSNTGEAGPVDQPTLTSSDAQEPGLSNSGNESKNTTPGSSDWGDGLSILDNQGQVEVTVTPINLNNPGETIDFEISLNTHSVDLSMDLAEMATLKTDTGKTVEASIWDAPSGGHHVGGKLSFPARVDGISLLEEAREVHLIITELDTPERVFVWQTP